jgi:hypothetical protein
MIPCTSSSDQSQFPRIVHRQRARKLRRRGVYLEHVGLPPGTFVWYETNESWLNRQMQRSIAASIRKAARSGPLHWSDAGLELVRSAAEEAMAKEFFDGMPVPVYFEFPKATDEDKRQRVMRMTIVAPEGLIPEAGVKHE